ncbi:hypothetical protein Q9L58_007935 [Maublancomyces gigas]|uniref:Uncharacterized protein n=1 Tax=Discina gigas TaxID=1032678 RepID=A0ABR3GB53_9PEZI
MQFFKSLTVGILALCAHLTVAAPAADTTALQARDNTLEARNLEYVSCYGFGAGMDRSILISAIDTFCAAVKGQFFGPGHVEHREYIWSSYYIIIEAKAEGSCSFTVNDHCNRLLRMPVDLCNTNGENGKQGGYVYEVPTCGWWRVDPQQGNTRIAGQVEGSGYSGLVEPVTLTAKLPEPTAVA